LRVVIRLGVQFHIYIPIVKRKVRGSTASHICETANERMQCSIFSDMILGIFSIPEWTLKELIINSSVLVSSLCSRRPSQTLET
jgi:hypothetical protein